MCVRVCVYSLGEVGELPPPSVEEVEGGLASTGRGTGRAIGGGGGGGSMGVGRKGLWTFPWELPFGWRRGGEEGGTVREHQQVGHNLQPLSSLLPSERVSRFPRWS